MRKQAKVWFVYQDPHTSCYRAELWWRPFSGHMVACTRWVSSKAAARRDGREVFSGFRNNE